MSDTSVAETSEDPVRAVASAFPIADRKAWIALLGMAIIFAGGFIWLAFGQAPQTVRADGIVVPARGFVDVGIDLDGTLDELLVSPGDMVTEGDVVARLVRGEQSVDVNAPTTGTVASILERIGGATSPGQPILTMSSTTDAEVVVAFIPATFGSIVKAGMPALVAISTYPESQYGTITGTVVTSSTLPVTEERIDLLVGGNDALVRFFAEAGPVLEIAVRLDPDPSAASGYRWTIGRGPDEALTVGTLATVSVIIEDGSPLTRLLQ